jgi:hypothetical protein
MKLHIITFLLLLTSMTISENILLISKNMPYSTNYQEVCSTYSQISLFKSTLDSKILSDSFLICDRAFNADFQINDQPGDLKRCIKQFKRNSYLFLYHLDNSIDSDLIEPETDQRNRVKCSYEFNEDELAIIKDNERDGQDIAEFLKDIATQPLDGLLLRLNEQGFSDIPYIVNYFSFRIMGKDVRWKEFITMFERIIDKEFHGCRNLMPGYLNDHLIYSYGKALFNEHQFEDALKCFKQNVKRPYHEADKKLYLFIGTIHAMVYRDDSYIQYYNKILAIPNKEQISLCNLTLNLKYIKDLGEKVGDKFLEILDNENKVKPLSEIFKMKALVEIKNKQFNQAISDLNSITQFNCENYRLLAISYTENNISDKAEDTYKTYLPQCVEDIEFHINKCNYLRGMNRHWDAVKCYNDIQASGNTLGYLKTNMSINYISMNFIDIAEGILTTCGDDCRDQLEYYLIKGMIHFNNNDLQAASETFKNGLKQYKHNPYLQFYSWLVHKTLDTHWQHVKDYRLSDGDLQANNFLKSLYNLNIKEYSAALKYLNNAKPEVDEYVFNYLSGLVYYRVNSYQLAYDHFKFAVKGNNSHIYSYYYIDKIYVEHNDSLNKGSQGVDTCKLNAVLDNNDNKRVNDSSFYSLFEDFILQYDDDPVVRGISNSRLGKYQASMDEFVNTSGSPLVNLLKQKNTDMLQAINKVDNINLRDKDYIKVIADIDSALVVLKLSYPKANFIKGRFNYHLRNYKDAIIDLSIYLDLYKSTGDNLLSSAYLFRGLGYYYSKEYDKALMDLDNVASCEIKNLYLGLSYYHLDDYKQAWVYIKHLAGQGGNKFLGEDPFDVQYSYDELIVNVRFILDGEDLDWDRLAHDNDKPLLSHKSNQQVITPF